MPHLREARSHRHAPLTAEGRLRLVQRCRYRPIAHVAAEAGVSRQCLSKWVHRYRQEGEQGLVDRSSAPHRQPTALHPDLVADIERLRREKKWSRGGRQDRRSKPNRSRARRARNGMDALGLRDHWPAALESWRRLRMPDLCTLDLSTGSVAQAWGNWQLKLPPSL